MVPNGSKFPANICIKGGQPAEEHEFPRIVNFREDYGGGMNNFYCAGVLIELVCESIISNY